MFNRKEKCSQQPAEKAEEKLFKCDDCKHMIQREDAQFIKGDAKQVFCPEHKKNYEFSELILEYSGSWRFPSIKGVRFYSKIEVSKDGTPIGYKKIDKK